MNIKRIALVMTLLIATSGIATAAQEDADQVVEHAAPYVVATQGTGVISFDENGKAAMVQDSFLVAVHAPVHATAPAPQAVRGARAGATARVVYVTSTGYNSEVAQTDSSPFIAADGTRVYDGMVAANFLPFGTKIRIPDEFGDKVFTVHDRMNKRYSNRVDVWFAEKPDALQWGRRTVRIEILGS